ncbi:MAG: TonB-dependent receptor [Bacteroidota bacterium]
MRKTNSATTVVLVHISQKCKYFLLGLLLLSGQLYGQSILQKQVSYNAKNESIKKVLSDIEGIVNARFVYSPEIIAASKKVNISVAKKPLGAILDDLFNYTNIKYEVQKDYYIILSKKENDTNNLASFSSTVETNYNVSPPEPDELIEVKGRVADADNKPLAGVSVALADESKGTSTGTDGQFVLKIPANSVLRFSYVGYEIKDVTVKVTGSILVTLNLLNVPLNDVVVIGYGTQQKTSVTGAINTVSGTEILKSPTSNVTNSLVGRLTGLSAVQRSGQPGNNEALINIRGSATYNNNAAIVVIDGVERSGFGDIDPNEIATISVLKDAASTAIFGIKGANGVIVITTKGGKEGKPTISYSGNVAIQGYTGIPKAVDAYTNALLMNEAMTNDNVAPQWTSEELEKFKDGSDPLGYPNVNWFDYLTRKNYVQTQHNINVSGGTKMVKYFASVGYLFEDGIFKKFYSPFGINSVPSNSRYNFRSNLDFNLSKDLQVTVRLGGRLQKRYQPAGLQAGSFSYDNAEGIISRIIQTPSFAYPITLPDGRIAQNPDIGTNIWNPLAAITRWGTRIDDANTIESTFNLNYKLDFITKGLSFKTVVGYDSYFTTGIRRNANWAAYIVDRKTKEVRLTTDRTRDEPLGGLNVSYGGNVNSNLQSGFNYERSFSNHNVTGLVLFTRQLIKQAGTGFNAPPRASQGVVGRVSYNYNKKYFVELNAAYNGSESFAPGLQYGLFPAISAGWTLSNEKFMDRITWVSNVKIRGSYGIVGNDKLNNRFLFLDSYGVSNGGAFGSSSLPNNGVQFGLPTSLVTYNVVFPSSIGNPEVTWEQGIKRNIGLEASFFKKSLEFTIDIFDENRSDILTNRSSGLSTYGQVYPALNIGKVYNKGYEVELRYLKQTKAFSYGLTAQISYAKNKIISRDEPLGSPENLKQEGKQVGQFFGYKTDGFYQSQDDINKSPINTLGAVTPGDLKFKDLDGNGIINTDDRTAIGYSRTPEYNFSISPSFSYKGISLNILFQGVTNVSSDVIFNEQNNGLQIYEHQIGRWTPATASTATWPKLHNRGNGYISYRLNDFILQDASYIKIRNAELAWSAPQKMIKRLKLNGLRFYLSGQNLVTWTKFKMYIDPENINLSNTDFSNRSVYPTSRTYNFGLNIQL